MEEQECVRVSVRNLVEFILRGGDIDNRISGALDKEAMLMGGKIHRKIQKSMDSDYHAEVSLKYNFPCAGFFICIEGRADGIIEKESGTTIDEIKGVLKEISGIEEPVPIHLAQAKCYAYIYAEQNKLKAINVQMTYCQMETEELKRFTFAYDTADLKEWFYGLVHRYEKWAKFQIEWKKKRNSSIKQIQFPYNYREGQRDVAVGVYRTIQRKKKLFIQAPTGVGKTMAAVFPAVKAIGEGLGERIFYLTARTVTRTVAKEALATLKRQGLQMKVITLTAKEKICFCEEMNCRPDLCPYAKGHFDRVNDAVFDLITNQDDWGRESLAAQAEKFKVCPFEMSLDASTWADAVICDYNYVFDPNAHLKRFFSEGNSGEYIFLIDEAHNLVERGREMYSAQLYKEDVAKVKKTVKDDAPKLAKRLEECNRQLLVLKRECEDVKVLGSVSHIALKLMNILSALEDYLEEAAEEKREQMLEFYFEVRDFLNIYDVLDENYILYSQLEADGRFKIKLFCVNPAANLKAYLEQGVSAVFFSATLLPIKYYKSLLSVNTDDYAIYTGSPFSAANRLLLTGTDVSTKYTLRGAEMYERYASYILRIVEAQEGNYMVFFPSYRFLEEVFTRIRAVQNEKLKIRYLVQEPSMGEDRREAFLQEFEKDIDGSLVGFCVMGGIFSEGIDLAEDRLIGAVIVGTGLPQVCVERELLRRYFDEKNAAGFDYAYLYPGANKVMQSAGRVIRTEKDRGVIVLLDSRFGGAGYNGIFPREWSDIRRCRLENISKYLDDFWHNEKNQEK